MKKPRKNPEEPSFEGLSDLLAWETEGSIETHIYHNESDCTFHPKVYLLRNDSTARLIVGSNNLTDAGLFRNTEAGLQIDTVLADPVIEQARTALASWRDVSSRFARKLDQTLLDDLLRLEYIFPEAVLRARRKQVTKTKGDAGTGPRQVLFRSQRYLSPPVRKIGRPTAVVPGTVLLMRVRRASETARRTQVQIPKRVIATDFFSGHEKLISDHDNQTHKLIPASARGGINTIKTEIPEIATMADPVLRLRRTESGIRYEAFDGKAPLGFSIRQALLNGFAMNPPATLKTIGPLENTTWWRFI